MSRSSTYPAVPDCRVKLDGTPLAPDKDAALTRVQLDLDVDLIGQCVLTFADPTLKLVGGSDFASGVNVGVELGFDSRLSPIFTGEVVALEPQFRSDLRHSLGVVCLESIHRLGLQTRTRALAAVDVKEVTTKVAREHGLRGDAPSGSKENLLQASISDLALLRGIAQAHGNHLRIEGKKLVVGPPPRHRDVMVTPADISKVRVRFDTARQVREVSVHGWDARTKRDIVGKARGEGVVGEGSRKYGGDAKLAVAGHERAPTDVATAESMAKGRMRKIAEGYATAEVEMRGNAGVLPGAFLILDGMGPQVEGNYRVERVRHEFSRHGYWLKATAVLVSRKAAAKKAIAVQPAQVAKAPTRAAGPAPFEERRLRERSGGPAAERDALAQAAVLLEAARTGSVFCEKCQAARKAAEAAAAALKQDPAGDRAAAAATSVDSTAAQTQASALRNAAQSGAAFCEKCEAARKALAEAATKPAEASRSAAASVAEPRDVAERRAAERQAAALRASAESGTAFCEKCEAAKEARSAGGTN